MKYTGSIQWSTIKEREAAPAVLEHDQGPPVSDGVLSAQSCVLYYYPLHPLPHPAQNLIRDRPRILRHFLRPDHAVPRPADEHHFVPAPCVRHISHVQSELIHADAPDDRNTLPIDKGMSPVGKAARDPISIAGGDDGDPPCSVPCRRDRIQQILLREARGYKQSGTSGTGRERGGHLPRVCHFES